MSAVAAAKRPEVERALELLRSGDETTIAGAARESGCPQTTVRTHWRRERPDWRGVHGGRRTDLEERDTSAAEAALAGRLRRAQLDRATSAAQLKVVKAEADELAEHLELAQTELALVSRVESTPRPGWLAPPTNQPGRRGTLVALFSDYHIGEVVRPSEMADYNAYDTAIAELRVRKFFERAIHMTRKYLTGVDYDGIVVPMLGDTISGDIHDEFRETNELTNYEAVPLSVPWIADGLAMFREEFGRVHCISVPGNHPRDSRKPRYKKRSAHNADTLIANLVARQFEADDDVTFDIPDGISADFDVYDVAFRAEHGDEARGGGGIQGAMLPIALRTHRIRKQAQAEGRPFDVLLMGHWHQLMSMPAKGFIVNGAGKGYDEFARAKGFEPEPPQQALLVVTPEHGISVQAPLFVGDRAGEGW